MAQPKKYIFINGVMQLNPEYAAWKASNSGMPAPKSKENGKAPLAIVSSMRDVADASLEQHIATGTSLQLAASTVASLEIMQDAEFSREFADPKGELDGSEILDGLTDFFAKLDVPVGLINKLMALQMYHLKFIVDDSGSMNAPTDSMLCEANEHVLRGIARSSRKPMTRWQEAETRLHNMMDILAFIPTKSIEITFMNAKNVINLVRAGKSKEMFLQDAHSEIANAFSTITVKYKTPTLRVLTNAFQASTLSADPVMYYLLTDGVPSDASVQKVSELIQFRRNPQANPLTLISCTDEDMEVEWMKQVEETAAFCAEIDDFNDESKEVMRDQGPAFPYTKGYWLICQLVAAINPDDLDAIDENVPFTKNTLDNMLGRIHTPQEFQYYFERNPHASLYVDLYERFLNEQGFARNFIAKQEQARRERRAGYRDGVPVKPPPSLETITPQLTPITKKAAQESAEEEIPLAEAVPYVTLN